MEPEDATDRGVDRRAALRKVVGFGAVAGAAWAAPAVNGLSVVPSYAAAQSAPDPDPGGPDVREGGWAHQGHAVKTNGCFAQSPPWLAQEWPLTIGNDDDGWFHLKFLGCDGSESVVLYDAPGDHPYAYQPSPGWVVKLRLFTRETGERVKIHETGWFFDPLPAGHVVVSPEAYPVGYGDVEWELVGGRLL